jgi:hypothetical protein
MQTHNAIQMGTTITRIDGPIDDDKKRAIEILNSSLTTGCKLIEFTCNCDEIIAKEDGITRTELMQVLRCPMNTRL